MSPRRTAALTGFALVTLVGAEAAAQQRFNAYEFFTAPPAQARAAWLARNDRGSAARAADGAGVVSQAAVFGRHTWAVRRTAQRGAQNGPQNGAQADGDMARARSEFERGINLAG